ncbi:VAMP-associated protein [Sistotremastrum suecicum HHB10207 ss-3]|uniref:VAMP-associated protein n=1 Tax=Sistotremastrum suecicum HHB10207 ss-3 TaxID=1314776 RepID=A0A166EUA4_9AGAM|nr:VAMP-associated protein [Sistotremastrum suecicum HHB10207 ss-3]
MSVALSPASALGFNRPLTQLVKRILTVTNKNAHPVAFKVKTTAPKLYCVRPNSGRIEPGESVDVQVLLQAMKEEPPLNAKCKDKFLIQSMIIAPHKENIPLHDLWNLEEGDNTEIHQQKVKVVYLPPVGETVEESDEYAQPNESTMRSFGEPQRWGVAEDVPPPANGSSRSIPPVFDTSADIPPPVDRGASPAFFAADEDHHEPQPIPAFTPPSPRPPVVQPVPPETPGVGVVNVNVHTPPVRVPSPAPRVPSPAPVVNAPNDELLDKFNEAQAEIQRLRAVLAAIPAPSPDIRRRTKAVSDDGASTVMPDDELVDVRRSGSPLNDPLGVPPQVVAIIALAVFTLTYLFF